MQWEKVNKYVKLWIYAILEWCYNFLYIYTQSDSDQGS